MTPIVQPKNIHLFQRFSLSFYKHINRITAQQPWAEGIPYLWESHESTGLYILRLILRRLHRNTWNNKRRDRDLLETVGDHVVLMRWQKAKGQSDKERVIMRISIGLREERSCSKGVKGEQLYSLLSRYGHNSHTLIFYISCYNGNTYQILSYNNISIIRHSFAVILLLPLSPLFSCILRFMLLSIKSLAPTPLLLSLSTGCHHKC